MTRDLYLDAAGAAPLAPEAREAIMAALDTFGDPLTIHAPGRAARALLEDARGVVARAIGAQADEIAFTSGGTESVALAIWGVAQRAARDRPPDRHERDRASRGRRRLRTSWRATGSRS